MKVKIVLTSTDGNSIHAEGYEDSEAIGNHNGIMRGDLFYTFWKIQDCVVYFKNVDRTPYIVNEW